MNESISELEARRMWPTSDADGRDHDASALREAYRLGREHEPTDAEVTVAARLTENVVDLAIGAVIILLIFLFIAFRLLWDNHIRYWIDGLRRRFGGKDDEK